MVFSNNFTVETDDEAWTFLSKDKICSEHFKWVQQYFFSRIEEEFGVFNTLVHTHLTLSAVYWTSSDILIDDEVFLCKQ